MKGPRAFVLLSGGLDSSVTLALAVREYSSVEALTFDYGQKARGELRSASQLASHYNVKHRIVHIPWLGEISDSALTGSKPIPEIGKNWNPVKTASEVWVPSRNLVFVSIASAFAESAGGGDIITGFNREEGETFPDNSPDFVEYLGRAVHIGSRGSVQLKTPLIRMDKVEISKLAVELRVPLEMLWFCYRDGKKPCFKCESCFRFLRGFKNAGLENYLKEKFGEVPLD